jgi:hypothetical protein
MQPLREEIIGPEEQKLIDARLRVWFPPGVRARARLNRRLGLLTIVVAAAVLSGTAIPTSARTVSAIFLGLALFQGLGSAALFLFLLGLAQVTNNGAVWVLLAIGGSLAFVSGVIEILPRGGSSTHCGAPLMPRLSYVLSFHTAHSLVLDAAFLSVAAWGLSPLLHDKSPLAMIVLTLLVGFPVMYAIRYGLVNGTIKVLKQLVGGGFRVVLFRRFSRELAHLDRGVIAPMFGAYGRNIYLHDPTLMAATPGPNADSEAVLAETSALLRLQNAEWKAHVQAGLEIADLAVFHWACAPTENMAWEYAEATKYLPPSRLVFVCNTVTGREVNAWLDQYGPPEPRNMLMFEPATDYVAIRSEVYELMRRLRKEPRPARADLRSSTALFTPSERQAGPSYPPIQERR